VAAGAAPAPRLAWPRERRLDALPARRGSPARPQIGRRAARRGRCQVLLPSRANGGGGATMAATMAGQLLGRGGAGRRANAAAGMRACVPLVAARHGKPGRGGFGRNARQAAFNCPPPARNANVHHQHGAINSVRPRAKPRAAILDRPARPPAVPRARRTPRDILAARNTRAAAPSAPARPGPAPATPRSAHRAPSARR
jgi:hypothetical protein